LDTLPGCLEPVPIGKDTPCLAQGVLGSLPVGILQEVSRIGCGSSYEPTDVVKGSLVVDAYVGHFRVSECTDNRRNLSPSGGASLPWDGVPLFGASVGVFGVEYVIVGAGRGEATYVVNLVLGLGMTKGKRLGPPDAYSENGRPRDGRKVPPHHL
jgi:hypothetical protein